MSKVILKLISLYLLVACAFAGQSIEFGPGFLYSSNAIPNSPTNRMEFYIHDWSTTGVTHILDSGATGWLGYIQEISPTNIILLLYNKWETGGQLAQIEIATLTNHAVYVRCQHDPVNKLDLIEAWDINGNLIFSNSLSYVSETDKGTTFQMGYGGEPTASLAFMRVHSSLVPLNSRPPVTSDNNNRIFEWKFDGDLSDASGNGHTASLYGATPAYVQTPYQNTIAVVKTAGANSWTNVVTQRAGYPAMMDGTASYSQADGSSAVTCSWASASGPTALIWDNTNSCTPVIQGLIFGDYTVTLTVTSVANGTTATASTEFGAVAMDDNGVVVNADPNVDAIFGPMIAYGKNPWGFADYWTLHAMNLRVQNAYPNWGLGASPQWENVGSGTVTYYWNGTGALRGPNATSPPGTALSSGISQTASILTVKDASQLDLSELPTRILLVNSFSNPEEVRICSASGNTLTVCYDGRGQNAQSSNPGTLVVQAKVTGSGTRFLTDAVAPVCPLGAPGPPGPASYSTGSVGLTAGSTTMTGIGTNWSPATGAAVNYFVRVSARHGGLPFQFIAQIVSVQPGTITLNRPYPMDADSGTYSSYAIMPASRTVVLRYNDLYNTTNPGDPTTTAEMMWGTSGCESEVGLYLNPYAGGNSFASGHDIPALDGTQQQSQQYSITDSNGLVNESSTGGVNFYGESLASRALYYRSGLTSALNAANEIDDYWIRSPWGNAAWGGSILFKGGGAIGAFASGILTGRVTWDSLRGYAASGESIINGVYNNGSPNCEYDDTRDTGYAYAWVILSAMYDPDTSPGGFRSRWRNDLAKMQANDNVCKRADSSWANGFVWNTGFGPLTLTANSTRATGTGLPQSVCAGTASGTGSVANGSATITVGAGSFPATGADTLVITGTMGGSPFTGSYVYSGSGSSAKLSVLWPGDTGNVTWMSVNSANGAMTAFATGNSDYSDLANNYACIWNSATSLTLDHPWKGATGSNYYGYSSGLAGFGQQPFMLGIKTYGMNLLANASDPALSSYAAAYAKYNQEATQWIHDYGVDINTLTTNYGRIFAFCEPTTTTSSPSFDVRTPGCNYGTSVIGKAVGREQNQELGNAIADFYQYNPNSTNRAWGDSLYGAVWGNPAYNAPGAYFDSASDAVNLNYTNLLDPYINAGKWYGFFAGMGMAHKWPAVRLGGVAPPNNAIVHANLQLKLVPGAVSAEITLTAPSGATQGPISCQSISSCALSFSVDYRQGSYKYVIQYLDANGNPVGQPVNGTTPEITTPNALPGGFTGVPYPPAGTTPSIFSVVGGTGALTWSVASGTLPPGLSLSPAGVLSGTPSQPNTFAFTVQVTDAMGFTASRAFALTINSNSSTLTIATLPQLPAGIVSLLYAPVQMAATDGTGTLTWSVTGGVVPPGLALSAGGLLSGSPTAIGAYSFTVQVQDGTGLTASETFQLSVSNWYNPAWTKRKLITVNGPVQGTLSSFPLLVSLTADADLAASARPDGLDILFTDATGSLKLSHEIESYSAGTLVAWVNVPSLSVGTQIYMYYGYSSAQDQQDHTGGTWDTHYSSVMHFGTAQTLAADSTANGNNAALSPNPPTSATAAAGGMIGGAVVFNNAVSSNPANCLPNCQYIRSTAVSSWPTVSSGPVTVEFWINNEAPGSVPTENLLVENGVSPQSFLYQNGGFGAENSLGMVADVAIAPSGNAWHHVVYTSSGTGSSGRALYIDGNNAGTYTSTADNGASVSGFVIGDDGTGEWPFKGLMDEFRVSGIARTAAWVATEYANQSNPAGFISPGAELTATGVTSSGVPVITTQPLLPSGIVSRLYAPVQMIATGGTGSLTWSVTGGTVPPGLTLAPGGLLSGSPTAAGSYSFTVQVQDSTGLTASETFQLTATTGQNAELTPSTAFLTGYASGQRVRNDFTGWVGMNLTIGANPLTVSSLGRICVANNALTHTVKFVNAGNGSDVSGASVSVSMAGCTPGQFVYASISPVSLPAATSYYLVTQETQGGDQWYDYGAISPTAAATVSGSEYFLGGWNSVDLANTSYVPPNFQYTVGGAAQYLLSTSVSPAGAGSIAASPSGAGGYYSGGTAVQLTATPASGCTFVNWSGGLAGTANPQTVTMSGPQTVTANFQCTEAPPTAFLTGYASAGKRVRNDFTGWVGMNLTIGANPLTVSSLGRICVANNALTHTVKFVNASNGSDVSGASASVSMAGCTPGQFVYASISPVTLRAATSYYLVTQETQGDDQWYEYGAISPTAAAAVNGSEYFLGGWISVNLANTSYVPPNFQYTVGGAAQYLLSTSVSPAGAGSIAASPSGAGGYYTGGTAVQLTATPASGCTFVNWSGGLAGTATPQTVTMSGPQTVTANFQCTEAPTAFLTGYASGQRVRNDFTGWVGMNLTTRANPLTVSSLGRICVANNALTHTVKFVNASNGSDVPGASASVSMAGCTPGQFVYASISPITLAAATSYYLVSHETLGGDQWYEYGAIFPTAAAAVNGSEYFLGGWISVNLANTSYVPPNFQYTVAGSN